MAADNLPAPIAVVGIGCRFPGGVSNPEELWQLLANGQNAWSEVPEDRFNWKSFHHPNHELGENTNHRGGHFLHNDIAEFDARFFGISSMEAEAMDPQQRLLLEVAYEALESAGTPLKMIRGSRTAVYMAIFSHDYDYMVSKDLRDVPRYNAVGTGAAILANRISHAFDLRGPSITIDTGCSGSIVALHQACQSLRTGDADAAFVGGVNLILTPDLMVTMSMMNMLNDDGKCYAFDSRGDGYGRGEGAGAVYLKRLDDALRDNDPIRAVIRNTGVNFDGKTTGITLPNSDAQLQLLQSVYRQFDPRDTGYFEAHGTGTKVGDKAEYQAIARLVGSEDNEHAPLVVGSIKSNIGHLESASGIAGLIKTILVLEKGLIPPTLNVKTLKPGLERYHGIRLPRTLEQWPESKARRASVNSFGYGGTNSHVIMDGVESAVHLKSKLANSAMNIRNSQNGYKSVNGMNGNTNGHHRHSNGHATEETSTKIPNGHLAKSSSHEQSSHLFVISAVSAESLQANVQSLANWLPQHSLSTSGFRNLAYTITSRRSMFAWRHAFVARDGENLRKLLESAPTVSSQCPSDPKICFIFTGQGSMWFAAARELMRTHTVLYGSMRRYEKILNNFGARWSLIDELLMDETSSRVMESQISQPASTAIQMALVDLLRAFHVCPTAVLGHSSGEIAAAYAAGILDEEEALLVAYTRSLLGPLCQQRLGRRGAMLATGLGEFEASKYLAQLTQGVALVACINSPSSTTISGDEQAIDELEHRLTSDGIFARRLKVDLAYHSHHMMKVAEDYLASLTGIRTNKAQHDIKFFSSVSGTEKSTGFGPDYWVENLVSPVRFSDGLQTLYTSLAHGSTTSNLVFVEVGPHSALSGPIRQTLSSDDTIQRDWSYIPTLTRGKNAQLSIIETLKGMVESGYDLDLQHAYHLDGNVESPSVSKGLPGYSWDHSRRYWHESRLSKDFRFRKHAHHDLIGTLLATSTPFEPVWRNVISMDFLPWLRDHVVNGTVLFPGSGYLCMAIEAAKQIYDDKNVGPSAVRYKLKDVELMKALIVPEAPAKVETQINLKLHQKTTGRFSSRWDSFCVRSFADGVWQEHCKGFIAIEDIKHAHEFDDKREDEALLSAHQRAFEDAATAELRAVNRSKIYEELTGFGNHYGDSFANLEELAIDQNQAYSILKVPNITEHMPSKYMESFVVHPTTLDTIFQSAIPLYVKNCGHESAMISSVPALTIYEGSCHQGGNLMQLWSKITPESQHAASIEVSATEKDYNGRERMSIHLVKGEVRGTGENHMDTARTLDRDDLCYDMTWVRDMEFATVEDFKSPINIEGESLTAQRTQKLDRAARLSFRKALKDIKELELDIRDDHLRKLTTWFINHLQTVTIDQVPDAQIDIELETALESAFLEGPEGKLVSKLGESLTKILVGEIEPLSILLHEDLLYDVYKSISMNQCYQAVAGHLSNVTTKDPTVRILEVGAGTGGATLPLLQAMTHNGKLCVSRYDFTDISSGFFEHGKILLEQWSDSISFKTLNIEEDPLAQGFSQHSYDYIVAANVIHATRSIGNSLSHVQKLLKPGGKLILIELTEKVVWNFFLFGTLPGWWLGEKDGRTESPLLSVEQWNKELISASFSGTEIVTKDWDSPAHSLSVIVSTARESSNGNGTMSMPIQIISKLPNGPDSRFLAEELCKRASQHDLQISIGDWPLLHADNQNLQIILDNEEKPFLSLVDTKAFGELTKLLTRSVNVLWVMVRTSHPRPEAGVMRGFLQSARFENQALKLVFVNLQQPSCKGQDALLEIIKSSFIKPSPEVTKDLEYTINENGEISVPRLIPNVTTSTWLARSLGVPKAESISFCDNKRHLRMNIGAPGWLDGVTFADHQDCEKPLPEDELQVCVRAIGLNQEDAQVAFGQSGGFQSFLGECSGIVQEVGASLTDQFQIGDRVVCVAANTPFANTTRVKGQLAAVVPDAIQAFAIAASIPTAFLTARFVLCDLARLEQGQSILIHSADGYVGQACISFAKMVGANIFATVESQEGVENLMGRHGIDASHIFSQRNFKKGILSITGGQGVNLALNTLPGDLMHETCECVGEFGTFVELCMLNITQSYQLPMDVLKKNIRIVTFNLLATLKRQSGVAVAALKDILHSIAEGQLSLNTPPVIHPMPDAANGFLLAHGEKCSSKVVLVAHEDTKVTAIQAQPSPPVFQNDTTFIVAGGLGGLGQEVSKWLGSHGAGHIVILTRRSLEDQQQKELEQALSVGGSAIHIMTCSIDDTSSVMNIAVWCQKTLPPVRGIINATMVVNPFLISDLDLSEFRKALAPKVDGTRNLYECFRSDHLSAFIMLSSLLSMIGNNGQANYGAGNSYQDSFAHNHADKKLRVASINLGPVAEAGALVERPELKDTLKLQRFRTVSIQEVLFAISYVVTGQALSEGKRQIILGFGDRPVTDLETLEPMSDPLFVHLPLSTQNQAAAPEKQRYTTVEQLLATANNVEAAFEIIFQALAEKVFRLTVLEPEEHNLARPVVELGLDSLITIELKNWILRTFQVTVQTFEIADAPSIRKLAQTLTERTKSFQNSEGPKEGEKSLSAVNGESLQGAPILKKQENGYHELQELPRQPLPPLEEIMEYFFEDARAFGSETELVNVRTAVDEFLAPDGLARRLQDRLVAEEERIGSWQFDITTKDTFLGRRGNLVPWASNYGTHFSAQREQSQAERAAIVTYSAAKYRDSLAQGTVAPPTFNSLPTCGYLYKYLFNTVRKAGEYADEIGIHPGHDYCVVLRHGRVFKMLLKEDEILVPLESLIETFQAILDSVSAETKSEVGILTSDRRDLWFKTQQKLCAMDERNRETMECIDKAAFVVCLDEESPANASERMHKGFFGEGTNRWHDKTTQFVVFANGTSGLLFEHSMLDGPTVRQLCDCIHTEIHAYEPGADCNGAHSTRDGQSAQNLTPSSSLKISEYAIHIDAEIESEISRVRKEFRVNTQAREFVGGVYPILGTAYLRARNCPPKSAWQLIIQLATRMHYGYSPACWEAIMQNQFYKGRVDIHQVISLPVRTFIDAMLGAESGRSETNGDAEHKTPRSNHELRRLFFEAAASHNGAVTRTARGRGFDRQLSSLRAMLRKGESLPTLFSDPVYQRMRPRKIISTASTPGMMEVASDLREPDAVWVQYEVCEDNCRYNLMGPSGQTPLFREKLLRAAELVQQMLETD